MSLLFDAARRLPLNANIAWALCLPLIYANTKRTRADRTSFWRQRKVLQVSRFCKLMLSRTPRGCLRGTAVTKCQKSQNYDLEKGRAIPQTVRSRFLHVETRVHCQGRLRGTFGGQNGPGTSFSQIPRSCLIWGLDNKPIAGFRSFQTIKLWLN